MWMLGTFPLDKLFFLLNLKQSVTQTVNMAKHLDFVNLRTQTLLSLHIHPASALAQAHSQFALCNTKANKIVVGGGREEEHGYGQTSNIMTGRPSK